MERNVVNWFEIYVEDMERAKKFYEAVLQKNLNKLDMPEGGDSNGMEMYGFPWVEDVNAAGASGALVKQPMRKPSAEGTIVYFACEDCSAEESRVADAGGKVIYPKMSIGEYGFISLVSDTEGNVIGLHSIK